MLVSEVLNSNAYVQLVPNKSHSQELNNVLFCIVVINLVEVKYNTKNITKTELPDRLGNKYLETPKKY